MNALEVKEALHKRWPDDQYLHIEEAPEDAMRMGRKIDVLILSQWASRGHELDAVEVKVSASDWKRELKQAHKADFWWEHTHRFWVAVPAEIVDKVKDDLPPTWGLLSVRPTATTVVVQAPKHDAKPLPWKTVVGVMRASANAGAGVIMRAEQRGRDEGYKRGKAEGEKLGGGMGSSDFQKRQFEELRDRVRDFQRVTGLKVNDPYGAERLGKLVSFAGQMQVDPTAQANRIRSSARTLADASRALEDLVAGLEESMKQPVVLEMVG